MMAGEKTAKELTSKSRGNLPDSAFVFPKERKFPIHDEAHARNALARAHFASDPAKVRAAVHARYPGIQEKVASVAKGLLSGLLGVSDFTPTVLSRQAGKGIRRAVVPVGAAGGAAALVKKQEQDEDDQEPAKEAGVRDNLHLGLLGLGTVGALSSAHSAHRAATTREKEYKQKYEKTAMWDGFDKEATVFNIKHGKELSAVTQKLRNLMNKKAGIFDAIGRLAKTEHKVVHELGPESLAAIHRMAEGVGKKSKPMEILKSGLLGAGGLAAGTAIGGALGSRLGRRVAPAKPDT
jgi:hypothetical protein